MGASGWDHFVDYQPDLQAAFEALQARVFADGDYLWPNIHEGRRPARDCPDRPATLDELYANEGVQQLGTHSILDMVRVLPYGQPLNYGWLDKRPAWPPSVEAIAPSNDVVAPLIEAMTRYGEPEYGTIAPVTAAEARNCAGTETLTRDHLEAIDGLLQHSGFGRCAVLHDAAGSPNEIYFWGVSGI